MEGSPKNKIRITGHQFVLVGVLALLAVGFLDNQMLKKSRTKPTSEIKEEKEALDFKFWAWAPVGETMTEAFYANEFKNYKEYGVDAIMVSDSTDLNYLKPLEAVAKKEGLELLTWTLSSEGDKNSTNKEGPAEQKVMYKELSGQWHVEILYPMTLRDLDGLDFDCIRQVAKQGNIQTKGEESEQYLGKYLMELPPAEFKKAILRGKDQGAKAVFIFETSFLTPGHWEVIEELKSEFAL